MFTLTMRVTTLLALASLAGCASTLKATHDFDQAANFGGYQTYGWIAEHPMKVGPSTAISNPLLERRIMEAVERSLEAKGFRKVEEAAAADFVVSFTVGSREEIDVDSYPSMGVTVGMGYPRHWGWGGMYYGYGTETTVRQYTTGMLAIDIFDVGERRPVWHGVAEKRITEGDREAPAAAVNAAVDAVLAAFPPP